MQQGNKKGIWQTIPEPFQALKNKVFAKLYLAQTISLIGDAFSWVGLALLAYQLDEDRASAHPCHSTYLTGYSIYCFLTIRRRACR